MDPRHQPAKGQGELGHLPFRHQQLGYVLQNSAALNILTQNPALAELSKMRHRRGQKAPRGLRGMRNLSEMTRKHWALGTETSPSQGEKSCGSFSYRFNFKYVQYSRKWNQSHCSQTGTGMDFSVQHHLMALPKTFTGKFLHPPISHPQLRFPAILAVPSRAAALSVIPFISCPKTVPDVVPAPQESSHPSVLSVPLLLSIRNSLLGMGGHLGVFALQVWICFTPKQTHLPRNRRLLS